MWRDYKHYSRHTANQVLSSFGETKVQAFNCYCTAENFCWCIFSYNFEFFVSKILKFWFSNFPCPSTHVPLRTFRLTVHACFFHHQDDDTRLPYLQGHLEHHNRRKVAAPKDWVVSSFQAKYFIGYNFRTICMCLKHAEKSAPFENFPLA